MPEAIRRAERTLIGIGAFVLAVAIAILMMHVAIVILYVSLLAAILGAATLGVGIALHRRHRHT